ncbi:hypothetical protein UA08_07883 [Talaromyces atroroseus]|uniref:E3 SUMO-protein ligase pli1 n=1 Tax=Talaromyces atroroseus TaxID=1441469 RepID=A0A225AQP2_TALAT|nr:hypothetical protein UA08_07883 [Talaromyces atroroseus]OKL56745.1 hypothetical protein UA08_07883 [Talaromyces atroroseus]
MTSSGSAELQSLISVVKIMTNAQMKEVLRSEGLAVSGVKISLQLRIIEYLERICQNGAWDRFDRLQKYILSLPSRSVPHSTSYQYQQSYNSSRSSNSRDSVSSTMPPQPFASGRLTFKESPFYKILEQLSPTVECKVREQTRDTVELKFTLSPTTATRLQNDPNLRVMVFSAADNGLTQYSKSDIAFPHQVELKANLDEVKANLRGLKNRPGSTRPADVTNYIRKRAGYTNIVSMTFALTQKRHPVEELVTMLKTRKQITKDQVLREMRSRAHDADIVATSTVMSLKCPLSTLRIEIPCRSVTCTHHQCFDASSFLQLQEQAPTWTCPVCNKFTGFESLQVDQYVDEILKSTSTDVEQVTIEPDGVWHDNKADSQGDKPDGEARASDADEDFIEIADLFTPTPNFKREETTDSANLLATPVTQSRFKPASSLPKSGQKRPPPQVVDLTGSDDEDDQPTRPAKRQAFNDLLSSRRGSQNSFINGYATEDLRSSTGQESLSLSPGRSNIYIDL